MHNFDPFLTFILFKFSYLCPPNLRTNIFMKQQLLFLHLAFGLLLMTACQGNQSSTGTTTTTRSSGDTSAPLVMHAHRYLIQDAELYKTYEAQSQKKLTVYRTSGVQAIEQAKNGQLKGDIILVEDLYQAHQLAKLGAIEPYNAGTFDEFIPSQYIDMQGYWGGITKWTMSFVYRTNKAEMMDMQRYAGILDSKYRGRVVTPHPDSSGLVTFVAGMLAKHGEKPTRIYLQMLNKNLASPPSGSDWDAMQSVLNGEADIAFMNGSAFLRFRNSGNYELHKKTTELTVDIPVDATGDNYFNVSTACIIKNAPNRNYAIKMVEFLTIQDNQNVFAESTMEYPLNVYSLTSGYVDDIYNLAQGSITMEEAENQLDKARDLIKTILGV